MDYLVVASWDANFNITGMAQAVDEADAIRLQAIMVEEGHADAFYDVMPVGSGLFSTADPVAQTVTFDKEGYDQRNAMVLWDRLRTERNTKLSESDWTQSPDSPLDKEAKTEWAVHRQSLRDLPASTEDPADPTWPEAPE